MTDLYKSRWGVVIAIVAVLFFWGAFLFESLFVRNFVWVIFFVLFSAFNLINWRFSGKSRYLVVTIVFFAAMLIGVSNLFLIELLTWRAIWLISVIMFVLAVPIAALVKSLMGGDVEEKA